MKTSRLVTTVLCCALLLCVGCGGRKSEQYRSEGDTLLGIGKLEAAQGAFERALEMNPKNAAAKVGVGRCLLIGNKRDEALETFRDAIRMDPTLEPAYKEAVGLMLDKGETAEAMTLAETLRKIEPIGGTRLVASVLRQTNRPDEALEILKSLSEEHPAVLDIQRELAMALLVDGNSAEAEPVLRRLLSSDFKGTTDAGTHLLLVEACHVQGKTEDILKEYEELTLREPNNPAIRLSFIQALLNVGKTGKAEKEARALFEKAPDSGWSNFMLGTCLLLKGDKKEALPYLEHAATILPNQSGVTRNLNLAKAGGATSRISPQFTPKKDAAVTEAAVLQVLPTDWNGLWKFAAFRPLLDKRAEFLRSGEPNVAETLAVAAFCLRDKVVLDELTGKLPEDSPFSIFFDAMVQRDVASLVAHIKSWQETEPERIVLRANASGMGLAMLGARLQGAEILSNAIAKAPEYGATYYSLAQVLSASGSPEAAAQVLRKLASIAVSNVDVHVQLWAILKKNGSLKDAQRVAEVAYSLFPELEVTSLNLAQGYMDTHDLILAEKVLRRARQDHPHSQQVRYSLVRLLMYSNNVAGVSALVDEERAGSELPELLGNMTAFYFAGIKDWNTVLEYTESYDKERALSALRWLRAEAFLQLENKEGVDRVLETIEIPKSPHERVIMALQGDASQASSEEKSLAEGLRKSPTALKCYFRGLAFLTVPAYRLVFEQMEGTSDALGGDPILIATMLDCAAKAFSFDEQEDILAKYSKSHLDSAQVWLALARMHGKLGNLDEQGKALDQAVNVAPDMAQAWWNKASFMEKQGSIEDATQAYVRFLELEPDDLAANNNLAYCMLLTDGDLDKALACAERAVAIDPTEPNVRHTLGLIQLRRGELDGCAKNLKIAISLRPIEPTFMLDYGQLLIAQKKPEEGIEKIKSALKYCRQLQLPFPRRAEAEDIVRQHEGG
ncbi:tetratricopeptide repeat protein [Candidatus Hydrogenedentota bacterium]